MVNLIIISQNINNNFIQCKDMGLMLYDINNIKDNIN